MQSQIKQKFGQNILARRKACNLSQTDLAYEAKMTREQISNIERGQTGTTIETLLRICAALRCTPNDLLPQLPPREEYPIYFNVY